MNTINSFEHQILIAMPSLDNTWFEKTVIYVVEDNEHGSMGLVLNLPHKLNVSQLLDHFKNETHVNNTIGEQLVLMGGPVDLEHGFILYKGKSTWQHSMKLRDNLNMAVSEDILKEIGKNAGPEQFIICLGFAGWEKGQLAKEVNENSWLTIPYNDSLLFEIKAEKKWNISLATLGISPEFLSAEAGHDC
jgi:putative transcriptional regulator